MRRPPADHRHRVAQHAGRDERREPFDAAARADPARPAALGVEQRVGVDAPGPRAEPFRGRELAGERVAGAGRHDHLHVRMHLRAAGRGHVVPRDDPVRGPARDASGRGAHEVARDREAVDDHALRHRVHRLHMLAAQHGDGREVIVREEVRDQHRIAAPQPAARDQVVGKPRRGRVDPLRAEGARRPAEPVDRREIGRRRRAHGEVTDACRVAGQRVAANLALDFHQREVLARIVQARALLLGSKFDHVLDCGPDAARF